MEVAIIVLSFSILISGIIIYNLERRMKAKDEMNSRLQEVLGRYIKITDDKTKEIETLKRKIKTKNK